MHVLSGGGLSGEWVEEGLPAARPLHTAEWARLVPAGEIVAMNAAASLGETLAGQLTAFEDRMAWADLRSVIVQR